MPQAKVAKAKAKAKEVQKAPLKTLPERMADVARKSEGIEPEADAVAAAVVADMPTKPMGERLGEALKRTHGRLSGRILALALVRADARLRTVR